MFINSKRDEGLYNLYFHACPNYYLDNKYLLSFNVDIFANNNGNYLSVTDMPFPKLYLIMSLLFLLAGILWTDTLRLSKHPVFKIHFLMGVFIFLKSLSLMLRSTNYHLLEVSGDRATEWSTLFYIVHFLKNLFLFITIVLIATRPFPKNIFVLTLSVTLPLQVASNIAEIIVYESESGSLRHFHWRDILIITDMLYCLTILIVAVWGIRSLRKALRCGKTLINVKMLRLFQLFYFLIIGYIFLSRIFS